jgi:hypothetical protein
MNWFAAKKLCAGKRMKLPTTNELLTAYRNGANLKNGMGAGDWPSVGYDYWTGEEQCPVKATAVFMANGTFGIAIKSSAIYNVQCVRR